MYSVLSQRVGRGHCSGYDGMWLVEYCHVNTLKCLQGESEVTKLLLKKMADALNVQLNIRQNAEELQDLLKDLDSWQDEMKVKDEELRHSKIITKQVCFYSRL